MDLQVAIFLLIFLSLSSLATIGICFVEIRSCWRQYRFRVEMQKLRKLNLAVENANGEIVVPSTALINDKDHCLLESAMDPMLEQPIINSYGIMVDPSEHHNPMDLESNSDHLLLPHNSSETFELSHFDTSPAHHSAPGVMYHHGNHHHDHQALEEMFHSQMIYSSPHRLSCGMGAFV